MARYSRNVLGGVAYGMSPSEFDPKVLHQGMLVEREHADDDAIAKKIAMDHIRETGYQNAKGLWTSRYYDYLAESEKKLDLEKALFPLGAYKENPAGAVIWGLLSLAGTAAGAYHGYKRNKSVGWAIWWGFWGGAVPILTIPIAYAQGFAEPKA